MLNLVYLPQNRKRLYWTNFPIDCDIQINIILQDILEEDGIV